MRDKSYRRHAEQVKKTKYKKILESAVIDPTDREIGRYYATHGAPCSCNMCCNPRHSNFEKDGRTNQEKKSDITFREEINET